MGTETIRFDRELIERNPAIPATEIYPRPPTRDELLTALRCIDLTTLAGDDTSVRVEALCARASTSTYGERVAAVCVFPTFVQGAKQRLQGTPVNVATVAAAFPHGLSPLKVRIAEVKECRELGADEIDIVIRRSHALEGRWEELFEEVRLFKEAAGQAHLKAILATGELGSPTTVYRAAMTALMAGADFVKTSTGKESVNATPESANAMLRAARDWQDQTGVAAGFKAAGGIKTAAQAVTYMRLATAVMGEGYIGPKNFRLGASSLLDDIEVQLKR